MEQLIERKITTKTGAEGSKYDPHHFTETKITEVFTGTKKIITVHYGLSVWINFKIDQNEIRITPNDFLTKELTYDKESKRIYHERINSYEEAEKDMFKFLDKILGYSFDNLLKASEKIPKCKCGSKKQESFSGLVGEHVICCKKCGSIIWSEPITEAMIA
jgi:hypothetical protein